MNHFLKLATFTIAILTLGFTAQSCTPAKPVTQTDLAGHYWVLSTLKGEGAADAFKGSIPSLKFDFEKQLVSGSGGCNRYTGGFTLDQNLFKAPALASTMMACMEANKENEFTSTLSKEAGLVISIEKDILTFKDNNTTVLEFKKGEAPVVEPVAVAVDSTNLVGTWTLSKIKGNDTSKLFAQTPATLIYAADGAVNGNAGCNNYRCKATLEGSMITFGPMMSTKMACPNLEGEQLFTSILAEPVEGSIKEGTLLFTQKGEVVLEFTQDKK